MKNIFTDAKYTTASDKALDFIKRMLDPSEWPVHPAFNEHYSDDYKDGIMYGTATGLPYSARLVSPTYIRPKKYYYPGYTGIIEGTYDLPANMNTADYAVAVYMIDKNGRHLRCHCPLIRRKAADGTFENYWCTGALNEVWEYYQTSFDREQPYMQDASGNYVPWEPDPTGFEPTKWYKTEFSTTKVVYWYWAEAPVVDEGSPNSDEPKAYEIELVKKDWNVQITSSIRDRYFSKPAPRPSSGYTREDYIGMRTNSSYSVHVLTNRPPIKETYQGWIGIDDKTVNTPSLPAYTTGNDGNTVVQSFYIDAPDSSDSGHVEYGYSYYRDYGINLYSLVIGDAEYLTDTVKLWVDDYGLAKKGVWHTGKSFLGRKICKAVYTSTSGEKQIVGISDANNTYHTGRLPASYLIPQDDPQYNKDGSSALGMYGYMLNSRSWVYDAGLALLVFVTAGEYDICKEMLGRLSDEQNTDGSWNFSYDLYIGQLFEGYVRTGAIGWLVWGACYYTLVTGDESFNDMLERAGQFLLNMQINDEKDPRHGLLRGGYGTYNMSDYSYEPTEIEWCSTEHNCSCLQALTGLSLVLGDDRYFDAAMKVKESLISKLYDFDNNRFYQGINTGVPDKAWALDCTTWSGKIALNILNDTLPKKCLATSIDAYFVQDCHIVQSTEKDRYNTAYSSDHAFSGFKPYSDRETGDYIGAPTLVWSEGTLGAALLALYVGEYDKAKAYVDEMIELQNANGSTGGVLYVTATYGELPWEFHAWESLVSSAWLYLIINNPEVLFPYTTKCIQDFHATREFIALGPGIILPISNKVQ